MIKTKMTTIPEKQVETIDYVSCDLCGATGKDEIDWSSNNYDTNEIEISMKTGDRYPESGDGTTIQYHICPDCFKNHLMKWFKEQGAKETKSKWSY